MRVLHLYSDRRKTGPAEPILQMCRGLMDRGHEVLLAYRAGGSGNLERTVQRYAVPATTELALNRYLHPGDTVSDLVRLPRFLREGRFDLVHTHLRHDHVLAAVSARRLGRERPLVLHTLHRREVLSGAAYRLLLRGLTDGLLAFTPGFRTRYIERFGLDPRRIAVQMMPIDTARFDPDRSYEDLRPRLGIPADAPAVGIVGRFQKYRKVDLFLDAARRVADARPDARFVMIGKSRSRDETVVAPAAALGLSEQVIPAGYFRDDYPDCLAGLDVFSLLMPGSDGTARAVREAMALGLPCVVSDFGMLPEIVAHGDSGLVVPMDPAALAAAWLELIEDPARGRTMGRRGRELAVERFDVDAAARRLEEIYEQMLSLGPSGRASDE